MHNQVLELRKAIAADLRERLYPVDVEEFPFAKFSTEDLEKALRNRNAAVFVSFAGVPVGAEASDGGARANEAWAVYVVTKDLRGPFDPKACDGELSTDRSTVALRIVPEVVRAVTESLWDVSFVVQVAKHLRADEFHRGETDTFGKMVWGVSWVQGAEIEAPLPSDLREFLTVVTRYDLAPADGELDAEDLIFMRPVISPDGMASEEAFGTPVASAI